MKRIVSICVVALLCVFSNGFARRGNPVYYSAPSIQYYTVDSDDNHPQKPTYRFLDTTFGSWTRVTGFGNPDSGYVRIFPSGTTFTMNYYGRELSLPPRFVHVNGFVSYDSIPPTTILDTFFRHLNGKKNSYLPTSPFGASFPLWSDLELRGDSSKIYYRTVSDTSFVSFYDMGLKGTNGHIRATFQIVYTRPDSSITFHYRSFDGAIDGDSAERIFERSATIGIEDSMSSFASMYLDRGLYHARSFSGSQYEKPLHDGLAVKFMQVPKNSVRVVTIDNPPYNHFEFTSASLTPSFTLENLSDTLRRVYVSYVVTNTVTGAQVYIRNDSMTVFQIGIHQYNGPTLLSFPCGQYRLTITISTASNNTDVWGHDNVYVRDFVRITPLSFPFIDGYKTLDRCNYHVYGASHVASGGDVFYDQVAPVSSGAVILDRRSVSDANYLSSSSGDTLTTAPIDLAGRSNPHLIFSLQRTPKNDSIKAGIRSHLLLGPESKVINSTNTIISGDSLVIEAIASSAPTYNPSESSWKLIAKIYGGIDIASEKVRIQIPSTYIHNHSRFRLRLDAKNDGAEFGSPFDDKDEFVIDGLQIIAPTFGGKNETDLEVTKIDLGAENYTHIPRKVYSLEPKVTVASNGLQVTQGVYQVRLVIRDQLNREVYHRMQSLSAPAARSDVKLTMPEWIIEGSQGGIFTCKATIEQTFSDYYKANDTNFLYRTLNINDVYALDDGSPDTVGTMTTSETAFNYQFTPITTDSLRGIEFFHLTPNGTTNWTITIRDTGNAIVDLKNISYNVLERGFQRSIFTKYVKLIRGMRYSVQCSLTQGFAIGGDASKGLVLLSKSLSTPSSSEYKPLYDSLLRKFSTSAGVKYYDTNRTVLNGAAGGPLLPMMRLVFAGSATYLPVELVSFKADRTTSGDVALKFETAKEENVSHFTIERSADGNWQQIATVAAKNSSSGARYMSLDNSAPTSQITYRLWEQDLDGSLTMLGTAEVSPLDNMRVDVHIYPNPASDILHIESTKPVHEVTLSDISGRVVHSNLGLSLKDYDINVKGLAEGVYLLTITDEDGNTSREKVMIR
ncbi:MAG TPA: T9SS type A sorting domain-containing protein [Candidatus Kapabacteria bacterium]